MFKLAKKQRTEKIINGYINENMTLKELSKKYNLTFERVRQILVENNIPIKKTCSICKKSKNLRSFGKDNTKSDKRRGACKDCRNRKDKKDRKEKKQIQLEKEGKKYCKKCKTYHNIDEFYISKRSDNSINYSCKIYHKKNVKNWINNNREKHYKYTKNWISNNKEKYKEIVNAYYKKQRDELAPQYLQHCLNHRTNSNIKITKHNRAEHQTLLNLQKEKLQKERKIKTIIKK